MKYLVAALLLAGTVGACSKPSEPTNNAVNAEQNRTATSPAAQAAGDNSFTESQAAGHLVNAGYTDVTGMTQDAKGVWHGTATKDGKSMAVSVDYQGTVTPG